MARRPRGRPTKDTALLRRRLFGLLRKGVPRERAARLCGIGVSTFHEWMAEKPDFAEAVCNAEDDLVRRAVATATDCLKVKESAVRLNAAKFILSHRFNREFSARQEVTGPDAGPVQVQADVTVRPLVSNEQLAAMTPEQLAAAIGALAARQS